MLVADFAEEAGLVAFMLVFVGLFLWLIYFIVRKTIWKKKPSAKADMKKTPSKIWIRVFGVLAIVLGVGFIASGIYFRFVKGERGALKIVALAAIFIGVGVPMLRGDASD